MLLFPYVFRDKYLFHPIIRCSRKSKNNRMSGGFPHSDIHGSKPIPGSPWLNAGYHVLHRLLLPRHPPNALFALDLIQEEQGPSQRRFLPNRPVVCKSKPHVKSCILTLRCDLSHTRLVYSTWTNIVSTHPQCACSTQRIDVSHTRDTPNDTDVFLSIRCQFV